MYNAPKSFILEDFSGGWDISTSQMNLDKRSMSDCKNFILTPTRGLEKRNGMSKLYATAAGGGSQVQDIYEYKSPGGTDYLLVATGTKLQAYYGAAWNDMRTGLTASQRYSFVTHQGCCYVCNGTDANFKLYNADDYGVGIGVPATDPVATENGSGTLSGKYQYVYCYRRSTFNALTGNPSDTDEIEVTDKKINVAYTASADPQVDKIVIYRTLDLNQGGTDPTAFFKVTEVSNATSSYDDQTADADLTTELEIDNTVPPKAKFVVLHKDRIFYLNCPAETDGGSLIRWSKAGIGEAAPTSNYQYFDRKDGEDITGGASIGDYLVVFKRNKIAVIEGDFENIYTVAHGVGNIAPWAILPFENKVIFLSEEGWKAFDAVDLYDISKTINSICQNQYVTIDEAANYSAVYYPMRQQFQYLVNHSEMTKQIFVGQFLVPLLYVSRGIPDEKQGTLVGWTYHVYSNHTLTCLAQYTDENGITRMVAGSSNGYVYLLDDGNTDDDYDIDYAMKTGWLSLDTPPTYSKVLRVGVVDYLADSTLDAILTVERDLRPSPVSIALTGADSSSCGYCYAGYAYSGLDGSLNQRVIFPGNPAQVFRFGISGSDPSAFLLSAIVAQYRVHGVR